MFLDETASIGRNPPRLGYGVAVTDVDGDGAFEFVVAGYGCANLVLKWDGRRLVDIAGEVIADARRNAIGQVVGFMSLENGLILAAVGVEGMPLIVEMLVAFAVMVAFIIFGIFFFHIRERFDTLDLHDLETFRGERR